MNHFKKFVSLLLALTLMLSAFSGCGAKAAPEAVPAETTVAPAPVTGRAEVLHDFAETVPYHGSDMAVCSDCSYSIIKP